MYPLLDTINSPHDLKRLTIPELEQLCKELRHFLIDSVLASGGHFASGLGVVELTVALHHVFNTPNDSIIWDVGHQAYPHKILTGRKDQITTIRQKAGLKPFPCPLESDYDAFGVGHSSTSISAALGISIAAKLQHQTKQSIAVIGDGALTAGQAFEALNHAGDLKADILVILNDNEMSISPNVGALSNMLTRALSNPLLQNIRSESAKLIDNLPFPYALDFAKKTEEHIKGIVAGGTLFEELDFQYFGPIDGHDLPTMIRTLKNLKDKKGPKLLHVLTKKGKGYLAAEYAPTTFHAVSPSLLGASEKKADNRLTYTQVFSEWLCDFGVKEPLLTAITPAMCEGSGLTEFQKQFPERYFDAAIAEQHSVTLAAGMAIKGLRPVVAIYSTFLQRAFDQLIHDVALQNLPVVFAIDRAGIVGADGPTHSGTFDLAYLRAIPNMIIMAPSDENECYQLLTTALHSKKPAAVRYPRGKGIGRVINKKAPQIPIGKAELVRESSRKHKEILIISVGIMLDLAEEIAATLDATVIDLRFIKPLDSELICAQAKEHKAIITLEDGCIMGGAGSAVNECLAQNNLFKPIKHFGIPDDFLEHGERQELFDLIGLNKENILREIEQFTHVLNVILNLESH